MQARRTFIKKSAALATTVTFPFQEGFRSASQSSGRTTPIATPVKAEVSAPSRFRGPPTTMLIRKSGIIFCSITTGTGSDYLFVAEFDRVGSSLQQGVKFD